MTLEHNSRARQLEAQFGDPFDPANPLGFHRALEADERGELLADGERLLGDWGCNEEFIPRSLGGQWGDTDELVRRLRPVFRRDGALGLGYGVTSLMAAVNVWAAGAPAQQRRLRDDLRAGHKVAVAFHELSHGNDFLRNETRARPAGDRMLLNGTKEVINNVERARSLVLFARTATGNGARDHSVFWLRKDEVAPGSLRYLQRYATAGMRGCWLGGVSFTDCALPADSLVGAVGSGAETALRAFQLTRTALPGMALGLADTALHVVSRFATERRLYGQSVSDIPHARDTLATAFTDLLVMDCLTTTAARLLHLAPRHASATAAAVKYLVPLMLEQSLYQLSLLLGARFYIREGPHAVFGKIYRDAPVLSLGHAGGTACLLTIVPQLPLLARRAWQAAQPPAALFDQDAPLPGLDFQQLSVSGGGSDVLAASLLAEAEQPSGHPEVDALVDALAAELHTLRQQCSALPAAERGPGAGPGTFALAERYTVLLAAAACLGVWRRHRGRPGSGPLGDTQWIHAALTRLAMRIGLSDGLLPPEASEGLFTELTRRVNTSLSCCLDASPIFH
ncbi:acyl-CoA dehydrogenase [Streptomyces rimosus]|uniref:acyl-CoA dehydrogenase n=1 Tax=Streptomyces rimosus TaxID=1927 RepID=UPI000B29412D|nr:acyl-CoA dehydrogenase [Streptomyces rimosus]